MNKKPNSAPKNDKVKNLDELIEILDQDQLRNVTAGIARPKGRPVTGK